MPAPNTAHDPRLRGRMGFTLLEVFSAIVVILILVTLLVPGYEVVRMRVEKAACINNLRQLYVGANSYIQEHGGWPQVNPALLQAPNNAYDEAWIEDFMPFGVGRSSWICPTTQRDLGGPDYTQPLNHRADYVAFPFDNKRITPNRWPTAPWFVERGNVHGNGNLVIESNGAVIEMTSIISQSSPSPSP